MSKEATFTPGPWGVFPYYFEYANGEKWFLVGPEQFSTIAEVRHGHDDLEGTAEGNARLIAGAPETMRAAVEVLKAWDMETDTPEHNQQDRLAAAIEALRAAISAPTNGEQGGEG